MITLPQKKDVYFMEINPRFQTSSKLLNDNLLSNNLPSIHQLNLDVFLGKNIVDIPEFEAKGSFLVRTYNDHEDHLLKPSKTYKDGFVEDEQIEDGTYVCLEMFDKAIENNSLSFNRNDVMKLKLQLMQNGIKIDEKTKTELAGALYADYVTCNGTMLKIGGNHSYIQSQNLNDSYLNNREYVTVSTNDKSKYELAISTEGQFLLKTNTGKLISDDIGLSRPMIGQVETSEVSVHGDRIRVSLITGCSGDCKFCGLNKLPYVVNTFETLKEQIDKVLSIRKGITRLFITGGNPKEVDIPIVMKNLEKLIKEYSARGIKYYDYMFAPRGLTKYFYTGSYHEEYEKYLKKLKKIGVTSVAVDIEMGNKKLLAEYAPFKSLIGTENYLDTIQQSVKIFGGDNVRSNIIVGIEPLKNTIGIIEKVAQLGAQPCISPYEPYKDLPKIKKPNWKFLYKAFVSAKKLCEKYHVRIAPSKHATDTHNSIASTRYICLTQTEKDAFYSNIVGIQKSIRDEMKLKK